MARDWQVVHLRLERADHDALMAMAEESNRSACHMLRHLVKQAAEIDRSAES